MIEFAGWQMPLQYQGIMAEHKHTRAQASLFDVSHMGQARITGATAMERLEKLSPSDLQGLKPMHQCYTLLLNDNGGVEDDCMIGNADSFVWIVINASRSDHDLALLRSVLTADTQLQHWQDRALLALQGPAAAQVMAELCPLVTDLPFMGLANADIANTPCLIARSGYTGEDGFEISCPADKATELARLLLHQPQVAAAGLGARDSLRLEAGLCLYGQDLDETTTPAQARLSWVVAKNRRDPSTSTFAGAGKVLAEMAAGAQRLRVGLKPEGSRPVRPGATLTDPATGTEVGTVTSGGFAPSLEAPYALGYVSAPLAKTGQQLHTEVRGHPVALTVCPAAQIKRG